MVVCPSVATVVQGASPPAVDGSVIRHITNWLVAFVIWTNSGACGERIFWSSGIGGAPGRGELFAPVIEAVSVFQAKVVDTRGSIAATDVAPVQTIFRRTATNSSSRERCDVVFGPDQGVHAFMDTDAVEKHIRRPLTALKKVQSISSRNGLATSVECESGNGLLS